MLKPRIVETIACSKCNEQKPYPSDYIVSYKRNTMDSVCAECRKIRRKEGKLRRQGNPELEQGWSDPHSYYRLRSNAIAKRKNKEMEND